MARELVPLKVKIGLKHNGQALYPSFNMLDIVQEAGMDWSRYVDVHGVGWHYDKSSGHREQSADSPYGQQWGVLIVPRDFVDQAVIQFPGECVELTETELENFYDNKAHIHEQDELFDMEILQGIKMKQDLGLPLTAQQQNALDPNKEERGIRKNKRKKWVDYKALMDIEIEEKI